MTRVPSGVSGMTIGGAISAVISKSGSSSILPTSSLNLNSNYSVKAEGSGCVVPQDLLLARVWNRLFQQRVDAPWESAVWMWIVSVPEEVVVADYIESGLHGWFVAAERHEEVTFEILSRAFAQILVLRVAAEIPMLFHPL